MNLLDSVRRHFHPLHVLRKSAAFRNFCRRHDRLKPMRVGGIDFPVSGYVFKNFNMMLGRSLHEVAELDGFVKLAAHNGCRVFWDVGANVGLYAFSFISADRDRSAVLFEPDPDNLAALRDTDARNRFGDRIVIRPCAVAAKTGFADFKRDEITGATGALDSGDDEAVFIEHQFDVAPSVLRVPITTLDEETKILRPPDIMKIDVEGHELSVLQGGEALFAKHRPALLFETSRDHEAITALLRDLDYRLYDAETGREIATPVHNTFALGPDHRWPG